VEKASWKGYTTGEESEVENAEKGKKDSKKKGGMDPCRGGKGNEPSKTEGVKGGFARRKKAPGRSEVTENSGKHKKKPP